MGTKWECTGCHFTNSGIVEKCSWCGKAKPGAKNTVEEEVARTNEEFKGLFQILMRDLSLNEKKKLIAELKKRYV